MKTSFHFYVLCTCIILFFAFGMASAATTDETYLLEATSGDSVTASRSGYAGQNTQATDTGVLNATSGGSISAENVTNIIATRDDTASSTRAHGVYAVSGGSITLGDVLVTASGGGSRGLLATGVDSSIMVNGDINVVTGGGNVWRDYANGIEAADGAVITINGFADIETATGNQNSRHSSGVHVASGGEIYMEDAKIRPGAGSNTDGLHAESGGTIVASIVDIDVRAIQNYSYGILAMQANSNITIQGGTVSTTDIATGTGIVSNYSNSALRASDGGTITVLGDLDVSTNGNAARGVYASGGSTIHLNNTDVTIGGVRSILSTAVQVGKSASGGTGNGIINSIGHLEIKQNTSNAAIHIEGVNSQLNADFETSSSTITSGGRGIEFGASASASDPDSRSSVRLRNADIKTTSSSASLIAVGGAQSAGTELVLIDSTLTPAGNGWLVEMTDRVITDNITDPARYKSSYFDLTAEGTSMSGAMNVSSSSVANSVTLNVNLTKDSTWILAARGTGITANASTISSLTLSDSALIANDGNYILNAPTVTNGGGIFLHNDDKALVGKIFTINGNYIGTGGYLVLDAILEDDATSISDKLVVDGNITGSTSVQVHNREGVGALTTQDGIKLVEVTGTSDANAFSLVGDTTVNGRSGLVVGSYIYSLYQGDSTGIGYDWYLRNTNTLNPAVPLYEIYPQVLSAFNDLGTLQERVGNRSWSEESSSGLYQRAIEGTGMWAKVDGNTGTFQPKLTSNDETRYDMDFWQLQVGVETPLVCLSNNSVFIGGITGHTAGGRAKIKGYNSDGKIETTGSGVGVSLTWYHPNGMYVDARGKATWTHSNIHSDMLTSGSQVDGNKGFAWAAGIEGGREIAISNGWSVTPQAQLTYSEVDFDPFTDPQKNAISVKDAQSLLARAGVSINRDFSCASATDIQSRTRVYALLNMYYEFLNGATVDISHVEYKTEPRDVWAGFFLGGTHNFKDDRFSIYGELGVKASLVHTDNNYSVGGNIGVRIKF